jgi:hypothetical protein
MFPRWIDGPISWEYALQIGGSLDGMLTELIVLREDAVVLLPEHLFAFQYLEEARPLGKVVISYG